MKQVRKRHERLIDWLVDGLLESMGLPLGCANLATFSYRGYYAIIVGILWRYNYNQCSFDYVSRDFQCRDSHILSPVLQVL